MKVKEIAEEWEIWDNEEEVARSEEKAKTLILKQFHKWIKVFGKKTKQKNAHKKNLRSCN